MPMDTKTVPAMNRHLFQCAAVIAATLACLMLSLPQAAHAATAPAQALSNGRPASPVRIDKIIFGRFHAGPGGQPTFTPGSHVPLRPGQAYGWVADVNAQGAQVRWREEFTLPQPPASWGDAETEGTRQLSSDTRVAITERVVEPTQGQIFNIWSVAPGDPPGLYKIRVFVEDQLVGSFEFLVR